MKKFKKSSSNKRYKDAYIFLNPDKTTKHPNTILSVYRSGAKARFILWDLTTEQFKSFWQLPCAYCGDNIETIGLDRLNSQEGYRIDNVVPCCTRCNRMKSDMDCKEFIEHCRKIICNKNLF
jgi:hypothetical protein